MSRESRYRVSLLVALLMALLLLWLTLLAPPSATDVLLGSFFGALIVFTTTFGVPLAGGAVSALPMVTAVAYLVLGLVPAGWVAFLGALIHGWIRYRFAEPLALEWYSDREEVPGLAAINAAIQSASIFAGGVVFQRMGGVTPLITVNIADLLPLAFLGLTYLSVNYLMAGLYIRARGQAPLKLYMRSLPRLIFYEGGSLIFAPLMALTYTRLGLVHSVILALGLAVSSLIARNLALARARLERKVKELDSLQAVGRAISASLDLETTLSAIYTQVAQLMPASSFWVALYDPHTDEVSFPLVIEEGQRVHRQAQRAGNGLIEYVLRTRTPLLIRKDVARIVNELGVDIPERLAACWLGVPLLAGQQVLGVITVHSHSAAEVYDSSHQEVLVTIAAQAAVAIQNARLYTRTDEALARRVQELDSILRTTSEGILLLAPNWHILAANRALADFLGLPQSELTGDLHAPHLNGGQTLIELIGYTEGDLQADCQALTAGEQMRRQTFLAPGSSKRYVERTLTPVRNPQGAITGWLLMFRDVTEEHELALLREEMTHMLVHDLRSPLTVLTNTLEFIKSSLGEKEREEFTGVLTLAEKAGDRMLRLINNLLDINKLESGQMSLQREAVDVRSLLEDGAAELTPLAVQAQISVEISADSHLPPLDVDPGLMNRVIYNLLDNATKFTPDGGHIRLWARPESTATVLIGVSDTGPGIPPEAQARLFKKFEQVISTEGRRSGTGLGLPFCKLAVEAHGGQIWVESVVGKGSTFFVRLPVVTGAHIADR